MPEPKGPISFDIYKQGEQLTEQDVKDSLVRAAENREFVKRLFAVWSTDSTNDETTVSCKRNGPAPA